ncbi:MAG: NADH-quinone oxidoreductase subunit M [Bryobacteraceae bacterium]|nr:NADH-quinone oxidoreductase subunit M [Bryobacteraceae bacterium]
MISLLLATPLAGMAILLALPASRARIFATLVQLLGFSQVLLWLRGAPPAERYPWIPSLGVDYSVAIDGVSLLLLILTGAIGAIAALASWQSIQERVKEYYALLLLLQSAMFGVFVARDAILFFIFFEFTLVPMYFLIGVWGAEKRLYAAIKFFLYTLAGSVFLLIGILALYVEAGARTFDIATLTLAPISPTAAFWIFCAFTVAFAVKTPMFPVHTWLPDAHTEAPTAGSVILAGVLLKLGTYGMLRFSLPLLPRVPDPARVTHWLVVLSIVAILYGALVCLMQKDWKRLIAYSSVSHMGFCTLGLFSLNPDAIAGSILQQVNHGISTGMLFLIVGIAYDRRHTRLIADYGGLARVMPNYAVLFAIAMLSSAGLPLLNGFVGEFTILNGVYQTQPVWAYWAVPGIVLGAAYLLWLFQRTMYGELAAVNAPLRDLDFREWLTLAPLAAWSIWIGVYPKPFFDLIARP